MLIASGQLPHIADNPVKPRLAAHLSALLPSGGDPYSPLWHPLSSCLACAFLPQYEMGLLAGGLAAIQDNHTSKEHQTVQATF